MLFLIFFGCNIILKIYRGQATNRKVEHHVCEHPVNLLLQMHCRCRIYWWCYFQTFVYICEILALLLMEIYSIIWKTWIFFRKFFVYNIYIFLPIAMYFSENLTKKLRNKILQSELKNIKYFGKYELYN